MSKKTLELAKETGNEIIVQVKSNQKFLLDDCIDTGKLSNPHAVYEEPAGKGHGRIEQRKAELFREFTTTDPLKWDGLIQEMIKVHRVRKQFDTKAKTWKVSEETSYYISTTKLTAKDYNRAIRNHWGIENSNHNVRDNALAEDSSRIRKNPSAFARLRSFSLNILRANQVNNVSLELFKNSLDLNRVLEYEKGIR